MYAPSSSRVNISFREVTASCLKLMVYINYGPAILIIPKEILEAIGKPKFFELCVVGDILYGSHPEDDRSPLDTQENVLPFLTCEVVFVEGD